MDSAVQARHVDLPAPSPEEAWRTVLGQLQGQVERAAYRTWLEPLRPLAYSVHAADAVMMMFGIGMGVDAMQYNLDPMTVEVLHWNDNSLETFYEKVMPLIQEADSFLQ